MNLDDLPRSKRDQILRIGTVLAMFVHSTLWPGGEAKPQSDIDLLMEFKKGTTLLDHAALIEELKELLGVKVDVVSERGLRERIRDRVLNETLAL
jgi:hypothetical protein